MSITLVSRHEATTKTKKRKDGTTIPGLDYIRSAPEGKMIPESFTAVVDNNTLGAHFHDVDQFQVVFGVPGSTFQRKPIPELMVHYADAFVTYGPIVAADPPLHYFTLRSHPSSGIWFMPEDRDGLKYRGRRHFEFVPEAYQVLTAGEIRSEVFMEDKADGLEARLITAGPGAVIVVDPAASPNGQYIVVVNGSVTCENKELESESLGWQDSTDSPSELEAGPEGCRLIVTRFPSPATPAAHTHNEAKVAVSTS